MPFKINISEKSGKTFKIESESKELIGKSLHDKVNGVEISPELKDYELEITGASDNAGFPSLESVDGIGLKKVLLKFGKGMKKRPKHEGKRKRPKNRPKGLRLRKTIRGKVISDATVQINLKVLKEGDKKLSEIFPEQNKAKEKPGTKQEVKEVKQDKTSESKQNPEVQKSEKTLTAEQIPATEKIEKTEGQQTAKA